MQRNYKPYYDILHAVRELIERFEQHERFPIIEMVKNVTNHSDNVKDIQITQKITNSTNPDGSKCGQAGIHQGRN